MKFRIYNLGNLQLRVSPFLHKEGDLIRSLNTQRDSVGAYQKRPGYTTYLGTPDDDTVNSLFSWTKNNGTQLFTYRASGSLLYHSKQGTGAWTVSGNGTITNGNPVFYGVTADTLMVGQLGGTTRHSTNGTSFTDTSGAPTEAVGFEEYEGRMWAIGTGSDSFYSTTGTPTDWATDSSSINIPGPGKLLSIYKTGDKLVHTKNSGKMYAWDGYKLIDMTTDLGPTSPHSIADVEGYRLYLNRLGYFGHGGGRPEIISNAIQRQIYNDSGSAIVGGTFDSAPAETYRYEYLSAVGTVTDDLTNETIDNAIQRYDYQLDEWNNWKFADNPTAFHSFKDVNGDQTLIWGDTGGQCYQRSGTALDDNGEAIETALEGVIDMGAPESDKKWNIIWAFTNPGCKAKIQVATADTFTKQKKRWIDLEQTKDGVMEARFPGGAQSKLLFWKLYESSKLSRWQFYGFTIDAEIQEH